MIIISEEQISDYNTCIIIKMKITIIVNNRRVIPNQLINPYDCST